MKKELKEILVKADQEERLKEFQAKKLKKESDESKELCKKELKNEKPKVEGKSLKQENSESQECEDLTKPKLKNKIGQR